MRERKRERAGIIVHIYYGFGQKASDVGFLFFIFFYNKLGNRGRETTKWHKRIQRGRASGEPIYRVKKAYLLTGECSIKFLQTAEPLTDVGF